MRTPWEALKSLFASLRRGEDPQREIKWFTPYAVAGVHLTADQSLSLSTVWACIDIIAKNIASCQWQIYEPVPGTKRRRLLSEDRRAWMLNTRPNDEMTGIGFREAMLFQAIPFGNSYAEIVRDAGGRVIQLWPLMTDRMMPKRDPKTWELQYHYTQPDGSVQIFNSRKIFHVRGPGLWGLMGDNVLARAAKTLGVAAAQERFSASFFGQGAQPMGVLEFPGKLTPEVHARLKQDWAEKHKGPENAHKPLILESGMKFNPITIDPQKSQLVEEKKFSVEEICRWFGVPPHKVQHLEHATFSNIEHSSIEFVRDALAPWAKRLCQEADFKLFDQNRGPWKCTEIDLRPLTYGDAASRSAAQGAWRQNGIMTANEIRQQEGLDDCGDDGDVLLVQANLTTVEKILTDDLRGLTPGTDPTKPNPALDPSVDDDETGECPDCGTEGEPGSKCPDCGTMIPDAEDPAENADEGGKEEPADKKVKKMAVRSALSSALHRYGKRMANRRAALATKKNADLKLADFRREQLVVLTEEMSFFNEIIVDLIGRELNQADMATAANMYERGEDVSNFMRALPDQLSTAERKVTQ